MSFISYEDRGNKHDPHLSMVHRSPYRRRMPLHPNLFPLCCRSLAKARFLPRHLACDQKDLALQSMGLQELGRPGSLNPCLCLCLCLCPKLSNKSNVSMSNFQARARAQAQAKETKILRINFFLAYKITNKIFYPFWQKSRIYNFLTFKEADIHVIF
jgi:hypothetical protein